MKKLFRIFKIRFSRRRLKRISRNTLVAYLIVSTVLIGTGLIFLLLPYFTSKEVEAAWFNDNWSYRQRIDVTNSGSAQTDFQVPFTLNTSTLISAGKMQGGCQDIRITDINGRILPYWIEKQAGAACNTTTTKIWTKMPSIGTTGNTLFVYYGNLSVASAENGNATFIYFDDFNANINTGLWTVVDATGTQITFSGGRLNFTTGNSTWGQAAYMTPSIARGDTAFEVDYLPAVDGYLMHGWKDDGAGASYTNLVYALYHALSSTTPLVYEDGNNRTPVTGSWSVGSNYKVRMRMRNSGGNYYDISSDGGINFSTSYTSTYSTESTLHPGWAFYSGTHYMDNFFVRKDASTLPSAAAPTNEEKAPTAVGYWKFDEGTGTVARTSTSPGFSPKDISGLGLWLDANAPGSITLATGVSQWNDLSGNGRNFTQATGSQQPAYTQNAVNGKPAVTFTAASSHTMTNSTNFSTPSTVIYIARQTGGADQRILSGVSNNWLLGFWGGRYQQAYFAGWVNGNGSGPLSNTSWHIHTGTMDGSSSSIYENGTHIATNAGGVAGPNGLSLNGHAGTSEFSNAQVAEVIVYGKILSSSERERVEAYLAQKWGLGTSLVNTNPFYNQSGVNSSDGILNNFASPPSATSGWQTEDQCIAGKCLRFDATNDYVSMPNNTGTSLTGDMSVSMWIKPGATQVSSATIFSKHSTSTGGYSMEQSSTNTNVYFFTWGTGSAYQCTGTTFTLTANTWQHLVMSKSGTTETIYVNGKQVATCTGSSGTIATNTDELNIGRFSSGASRYWSGTLDDFRIYNYARTAAQVATDFNARENPEGVSQQQGNNIQNMPAALSNGLVGYWNLQETATPSLDSSGNSNSATWAGNTSSTSGKFGYGNSFDGNDDYMTVSDSTSLDVTQVTMSAWINPTALGGVIMTKAIGAGGTGGYYMDTSGNKIRFCATGGCVSSTTSLTTGVWTHVSATFDGTTVRFYLNGAPDGTSTGTVTSVATNTALLVFAMDSAGTTDYNGKIDEARIYNRALSNIEISQLYTWAPGPVGYWKLEEGSGTSAYDASGYVNTGTITAGSGGYTAGKYGKGYNFDAASTIINAGSASSLDNLPATGMTAETWYYARGLGESSVGFIMSKNTGASQNAGWFLLNLGTNYLQFVVDGSTDLVVNTSNSTLVLNRWNHIAVSWDGNITTATSVHIYINGVETTYQTQTNGAGRVDDASSSFYIGNASTQDRTIDGVIDETKLYNYARTAGQITEDLNASHPAPGSPVSSAPAHWKFNEGADGTCSGGTNDACNSGSAGSTYDAAQSGMSTPATSTSGWTQAGKLGRALLFDGTDDIVSASGLPNAFFTASWTQTLWLKTTQTGNKVLTEKGSNLAFIQTVDGQIRAGTTTTAGDYYDTSGSPLVTDGNWHHIAVTYDATSNAINTYIDGIRRGGGTTGNDVTSSATAYSIGARVGPSALFLGTIDEVKVFDSALTADQIKLDMNQGSTQALGSLSSGQTVPNAAASEYCIPGDSTACTAPVARWDYEQGTGSSAYDTSGNANTGTITNATWSPGKTGKGLGFDGTGDYMTAADSTSLELGSGDFTIQTWIYLTAYPNSGLGAAIYAKDSGTAVFAPLDIVIRDTATDAQHDIHVWATTANGSWNVLNDIDFGGGSQLTLNTWHQVSFVRSSGSCKLYVDGVVTSTSSAGISCSGTLYDNANTLYMGGQFQSTSGSGGITGRMDNYRIFNYARTNAQLQWDYNRGKPTGYWKIDECQGTTINDSSGNSNTGTLTVGATGTYTSAGTCPVSSASSAWYNGATGKRNYSLAFDGTDDYVDVGDMSITESASQVSWSVWVKPTTLGTNKQIFTKSRSDLTQLAWAIGTDSSTSSIVKINISTTTTDPSTYGLTPTGTLSTGTWTHIVAVFDGTQSGNSNRLKAYINGIPQTLTFTGTIPATTTATTSNATLGATSDHGASLFFNGQIDDTSVYNYALTATQVKTLYNDGASRYGPVTGAP